MDWFSFNTCRKFGNEQKKKRKRVSGPHLVSLLTLRFLWTTLIARVYGLQKPSIRPLLFWGSVVCFVSIFLLFFTKFLWNGSFLKFPDRLHHQAVNTATGRRKKARNIASSFNLWQVLAPCRSTIPSMVFSSPAKSPFACDAPLAQSCLETRWRSAQNERT